MAKTIDLHIHTDGGWNLDSESPDALMSFWHAVHCHPVRAARVLFPHRPKGYVSATQDLARYASNKAPAIRLRREGEISRAQIYEQICDMIYRDMPEIARKW